MKYFYLSLLFTFLFVGDTALKAQAFMGFENLTTSQTCNSLTCNYTDPISSLGAHDLSDVGGIPVNSPTSASVLGFKSSFRPSRTGSSNTGLNDGDFFGYAGSTTINNNIGQIPTQGSQAFIAEDTDGEVTINFNKVDLAGAVGATFSMDYIVDGGFEFSDGADDLLKISLEITDCGAATTIDLVHATGTGAGGTTDLNTIPDAQWMTVSQNLSSFSACKIKLKIIIDLNSSTEEFAFDDIRFTAGMSLPVEFVAIAANQRKDAVLLDWSTATETDNRGFTVERSMNGRSFTPIGWVDGIGEAQAQVNYEFEDKNVRAGQAYYYRLRQEDFDGAFEYSSIVKITITGEASDEVAGQFFPNPAVSGQSNIELYPTEAGDWILTVVDANGRLLTETKHTLAAGYNLVPVNLVKQPVGTYLIRISGEEQTVYRKVIR
jgi:hypothetical protein